MFSLVTVIIILGCAALLYFKSTIVKSFAMIITAVCASIVAFGYFELLANFLISKGKFIPWAQTISLLALFILSFAALQAIVSLLIKKPVDLGIMPERIGRIVCGIFLGLIISGLLLTAFVTAPLSNKLPYQRFDSGNPNPDKPKKALFNADGFTSGWFSIISSGSFSGKRSFATLHPDFLSQVFLNRHNIAKQIPIITSTKAIKTPPGKAVWPAPEGLTDQDGKKITAKSGHKLMIARIGITADAIKYKGIFTLSQLRLICKEKTAAKKPLTGKGENIYPIGYLRTANKLQLKRLNDKIEVEDVDLDGSVRWIDFAFNVPNGSIAVLAEFKQNAIVQVSPAVTAKQAPSALYFIPQSKCAKSFVELQPVSSAKIYGLELATGANLLRGLTLKIDDPNQWQNAQTKQSIKLAEFEDETINYVRAELKREKPSETEIEKAKPKDSEPAPRRQRRQVFRRPGTGGRPAEKVERRKGIQGMLKTLDGYSLISLKCNNPSTGAELNTKQLPTLIDISGSVHHPVGVIASGKVGEKYISEFDYCSQPVDPNGGCIVLSKQDSVAKPFPKNIWLTEKADEIFEFYLLYMVKPGNNTIITTVQPADVQTAIVFKDYEGFLILQQ